MTENISVNSPVCPSLAWSAAPKFSVTAIEDIQSPSGRVIKKGDHVLIDPNAVPVSGKLVLQGQSLLPWNGREHVTGVVIGVWKDD